MARKKKRGQRKKHKSAKARLKAHRAKIPPKTDNQGQWERFLSAIGLDMDRGMAIKGYGIIVTGGIDLNHIDKMYQAKYRANPEDFRD